jgi:hypothetical protein
VTFPDLAAVVHLDEAPAKLLEELPELYSSAYSFAEYIALEERPWRMYACELTEPRHVIVFTSHGATVDVLNKVIEIEPAALERVVAAIFRARPEIKRIRAEVKFPPDELGRPVRQLLRGDDQVVELPANEEDYERLLGAATRKHLREYRNRLYRKHPDFKLRTFAGDELSLALVEQAFAWNRQNIESKGKRWLFDDDPAVPYVTWQLLQPHGLALCGYIGDEYVAGWLLQLVGRDCWWLVGGYDPAFSDLHLGFLMTWFCIIESIRRGYARTHLLFGTVTIKQRLGARPVTAWRVSIYRSRLDKTLYARERWSLLVRDRQVLYRKARESLRRRLKERLPVVARLHAQLKRKSETADS